MKQTHTLTIPILSNFEMEYYYAEEEARYNARNFPPHLHDRLEMYVLIDGDASFMVESNLYKLRPFDAVISKPNEMHNCVLNSDSVHRHLCFWFDASNDFLFADFLAHDFGVDNRLSPDEAGKARLLVLFEQLKNATADRDTQKQFYLTLEMLDIYRKSIVQKDVNPYLPPTLKTILADINVHFTKIRDLSYFTEKYFISQSTLNRLFRSHLHTTPKMYLETKRLGYSKILLKEGKTVLESCMQAGFPDYSNYIRLFKTRFGITPGQYRDT